MQKNQSETRSYEPSFVDRFMEFVGRRLQPYWLIYFSLFLLQSLLTHVLAWLVGWLPIFNISPILFLFPVWLWGPFAMMTHLDRVSLEALSSFKSLLDLDDTDLQDLEHEFTVMPAKGVLISSVMWSLIYLAWVYATFDTFNGFLQMGTIIATAIIIQGFISFSTGSALYYHSIRKLRLVNITVRLVKRFHLFRVDPIYAFSRVTSQIGVSWMAMLSLSLLFFPIQLASILVFVILALQVLLAIAAFILPLWFVNRRLVTEKRRLLADLNKRTESLLENLHRCLDEDKVDEVDQLYRIFNGLNSERLTLTNIPTWPWRSGTLTGFLSAIVLPIFLFLIQLVVRNWLGG